MNRLFRLVPMILVAGVLLLGAAAAAAPDEVVPPPPDNPVADAPAVDAPAAESGELEGDGEDAGAGTPGGEAGGEEEGPEELGPTVRAIVVRGNRHVDVTEVLQAIQATKVGQPLTLEAVQEDLRNIYSVGFFEDVRVEAFDVEGGVRVVFQVVENPLVSEVRITSEEVDPEKVREWVQTREGEVLNHFQLDEDLMQIQAKALEELGLYLRPVANVRDGVLHLDVTARRVRQVLIRGNTDTKDYVIRREIVLQPGEVLRRDDLIRSADRLQRLGFFMDVRVQGIETGDPDYVDVEFEVEERQTGSMMVGAGYSSEDGLLGFIELSESNFLGRGQSVHARAEFAQRHTTYDLGFYEPYMFGSPLSFGLNLYNRSFERLSSVDPERDYRVRRSGGDVSLGRAINEWTRLSLRYRNETMRTEAIGSAHQERFGRTRSVTLAAQTDTTDHWLSPMRGARSRLSTEVGGGLLGGDHNFTKYEAEYSRYFQVGSQRQAIALRVWGGLGVGDIREAEEQFRVGGAATVRGYPSALLEGDRMVVFNAEYRFPLGGSVQGVLFSDLGEAWWEGEGSRGMKLGVGVGARVDTPLGVLRLDYGIGDQGSRLHFFFGPTF